MLKANIGSDDYNWVEDQISTVAVKAALVSFNFAARSSPYYKLRCEQLGVLGNGVYEGFEGLKQSGHPKWNEVDLDQQLGIWERDSCSARKIVKKKVAKPQSENDDFLTKELLECVTTGKCKE